MTALIYIILGIWLCAVVIEIGIGLVKMLTGLALAMVAIGLWSAAFLFECLQTLWRIAVEGE